MTIKPPKLIATSVVRGTRQGESHGGVYTIDFGRGEVVQHVDRFRQPAGVRFGIGTIRLGCHLQKPNDEWGGHTFDPRSNMGPRPVNEFHINMVYVDETGITFSGLHTKALLHLDSTMRVTEVCSLPAGAHNARPYRDGVLFNDTERDCVRYVDRGGDDLAFRIETYAESDIEFAGIDDSKVARQGFGRGLRPAGGAFVAGGSSPSTISLYDMDGKEKVASVNLTMDIRNAIHGLELWPFDS